jgi:hypothetical protein
LSTFALSDTFDEGSIKFWLLDGCVSGVSANFEDSSSDFVSCDKINDDSGHDSEKTENKSQEASNNNNTAEESDDDGNVI